jgi:MFS family permease
MRGGPGEATATAPTPGPPARRERRVLPLLCACQFLVILDVSIVNVALPSIDRDLGFSVPGLAWVVNGYLLPFAGFMLLGGRAADLFGHRRMLIVGLALFSVSSLVAGLARHPTCSCRLVPPRAWEPPARTSDAGRAQHVLPPRRSPRAGVRGVVSGRGSRWHGRSAAGWRPDDGAVLAVGLPRQRAARRRPRGRGDPLPGPCAAGPRGALDLPGSLVGTAGLAALVYGVMQLAEQGWTAAAGRGAGRRGGPPARRLRPHRGPVRRRADAAPAVADRPLGRGRQRHAAAVRRRAIAMWYFTSLLLQDVLGFRALDAGLGQTPAAVTFVVVARVAAGLLRRAGVRLLVLAGCGCLVAGFGWLAQVDGSSAYATAVLGPMLLVATGIGLTFPTLMALATAEVRPADAGIVGGLANTASQVGGALGLGVLTSAAGAGAAAQASAGSPAADLVQGYGVVFLVAAGLALGLAALTALLPSSRRSEPAPLPGAAG